LAPIRCRADSHPSTSADELALTTAIRPEYLTGAALESVQIYRAVAGAWPVVKQATSKR
jgi:hypothetical protein